MRNAQLDRDSSELSITRPKLNVAVQYRRDEQVYVDVPQPPAEQAALVEKVQGFRLSRRSHTRQARKQREYLPSSLQMSACELADHEIMGRGPVSVQYRDKRCVSAPEVIHPYRGIDENHPAGERRRRGVRN